MKITSLPDNFAPVDGRLLYFIDFEGKRDSADVEILDADDNSVVAICRFAETTGAVIDAAPYVRKMFAPEPLDKGTGVFADKGRTVHIRIRIDNTLSPVRSFTMYAVDGLARFITFMPSQRTIAYGESVELPFLAPTGGKITLTVEDAGGSETQRNYVVPASPEVGIFAVRPDDFPLTAVRFTVTLEAAHRSDEAVFTIARRMPESCRVAWVATSGATEYYTFPTRRTTRINVDKGRYYSCTEGYRTVSVEGETITELVSDYEPAAMIDSLEEILASPFVWIVDADGATPVDVVTDSTVRLHNGSLNTVSIGIRTKKEREEQL